MLRDSHCLHKALSQAAWLQWVRIALSRLAGNFIYFSAQWNFFIFDGHCAFAALGVVIPHVLRNFAAGAAD